MTIRALSNHEFAKQIALRRKHLGLSQLELANLSKVSLSTISKIERGDHNPSLEILFKISLAYNTTPSKFLEDMERNILQDVKKKFNKEV